MDMIVSCAAHVQSGIVTLLEVISPEVKLILTYRTEGSTPPLLTQTLPRLLTRPMLTSGERHTLATVASPPPKATSSGQMNNIRTTIHTMAIISAYLYFLKKRF